MPSFVQINGQVFNADRIVAVKLRSREQHPDPRRKYVDDALRIQIAGLKEDLLLFDGDADAVREFLDNPKAVKDLTPRPPAPAPDPAPAPEGAAPPAAPPAA
jgi:hypothetical protein